VAVSEESDRAERSHVFSPQGRPRHWLPPLAVFGLGGLVLFQGLAYYFKLPLSLGPRVILQPWLLNQGFLQYENIADQHTPLMPVLLSGLTWVCSDGLELAKIVLVLLVSLSTVLTFLAGRRSIGWLGGLGAAFFFVVWSPAFEFGKLWHETFLAPLYLVFLLFYDSRAPHHARRTLFFLGLVGGIAILIKQHAAIVLAAVVIWSAVMNRRARRAPSVVLQDTVVISLAAIVPVMAFGAYHYVRAGTLANFLYWTTIFHLISDYGSLAARPPTIAQVRILASACLLLPAAILVLVELRRKEDRTWLNLGWGLVLLAASSLTACPRFEFFHFQAALPVLAWLSSLTLAHALRPWAKDAEWHPRRCLAAGVAIALWGLSVIAASSAYQGVFRGDRPQWVREYSNLVPLAAEISQRIAPTDRIYVFPDDEPTSNLYYLVGHPPPNFWVFSYPWYMLEPIRTKIVRTLEEQPPEWIVRFPDRWDTEDHAPEVVAYIRDNYSPEVALRWRQSEVWLLKRAP
jgi:hypothetical protein